MKCPHCEKEIPGTICSECGETSLEEANYCMSCGAPLKESVPPIERDESFFDDEEDIDFDNRILCPDGTCTGIIVDGRCTECGRTVNADGSFAESEDQEQAAETEPVDEQKPATESVESDREKETS